MVNNIYLRCCLLASVCLVGAVSAVESSRAAQFDMVSPVVKADVNWLESGWKKVEQHQADAALVLWQQGVDNLADKQLLIVLSLGNNLDAAVQLAKQAGRSESAFVLSAVVQGKQLYYVLSSREASLDPVARHQQLTSLREAIGVQTKLFSDSAEKFKSDKSPVHHTSAQQTFVKIESAKPAGSEPAAEGVLSTFKTENTKRGSESVPYVSVESAVVLNTPITPSTPILNNTAVDFSLIDLDYDMGRFEEALWALEDLQKLYPNHGDVVYRVGLVQEGVLDFIAARKAYAQAVTSMAEPLQAYAHLGNLLYKMKQYPEAIEAFQYVMRLTPNDANTSYRLAMTYMQTKDFSEAMQAFKHVAGVDERFKQKGLYGQGLAYMRMGEFSAAQLVFKESIAIKPTSTVAKSAKKSLAAAIKEANKSHIRLIGMYDFLFDSNVVLKPSTSPEVPIITGESDFEHTLLGMISYAPPSYGKLGYKASARTYANLHARLTNFDIVDFGFTLTPYVKLGENNVLSVDAAFDYILFNYNRYMDKINIKPYLTYKPNKQFQMKLSVSATRENYYQAPASLAAMQDGWSLREDIKLSGYSKDRKSSLQVGGYFTTTRKRGNDNSYNAYGGNMGVGVPMPYMHKFKLNFGTSIGFQSYQNLISGQAQKRRDAVYGASTSISYPIGKTKVGIKGSYTHSVSSMAVYSYVRILAGINISGSF